MSISTDTEKTVVESQHPSLILKKKKKKKTLSKLRIERNFLKPPKKGIYEKPKINTLMVKD